ncbi:ABC transporter permease [Planomonospora sp. ID91781]|uniref:Cell division protein FtsX n=3 Tax=Planomonospora TaxID=1998 RepID=A0A161LIF5_9ACTN|nr:MULTISPECIES: permease-like cell division protein FtsX [Planomonospora]MBG0821022.1 ABC transporter permease [Planomonospora sp. ID91781]GAT65237.1 cell division protein FtsX [Planomonospora sphaerica]GGK57964.1 cell division protein FtsX [Planomonospora parontospora]GII07834.1 cell division protein FtsX [Planomonospora parontospora subsp. parontospora]
MRANFIFSEVWIGLRRNLTMTIAVIVTVAIGMALLGVGLMINSQISGMKDSWFDKVEVSVFLCKKNDPFPQCKGSGGVDAQEQAALKATIEAMPQVERVEFEDAAKAYENFKAQNASNNVLISAIQVEDMPESFRVKLKNPDEYGAVIEGLQGAPGVSNVINQKEILEKFFGLLEKLRWAALTIAITLVFAAALLIGNTVRLSAYNRRRETGIMRLVGASNLYIQLPFVMEGVIAGLIGGVIAAVLLIVSKVFLFDSVQLYLGGTAQLSWETVASAISLTMIIGVLICVFASFVTLRRYLRV